MATEIITFFNNITGVGVDIETTLVAANNYLQTCYFRSRHSTTVDEWPPYQPTHYTTLALIHHKNKCTDATVISVTQELAVAGKIPEDLSSSGNRILPAPNTYSNTSKNISDIFIPVTARDGHTINPCIILIEGAPGIGKTVLAKEIAFQWACNKLLSEKKILLLLFLRQCNFKLITSLKYLVEHVVKSDKIPSCLAEHLLQTEGKDLAIVFDGYDEVSEEDRKNSIIADILCHRILAKSCIVFTSRPTASSDLHSKVDCRVEIIGFTEEDRLDYIQTALQGNDDKIKTLKFYLQSNPTINALCYIPLNMTILLCLVEDGIDKLPKTQTDMYKQFINMTILRFVRKHNKKFAPYITSISTLPYPHNRVCEDLAKFAYKALTVDKIVFTMNEIEKVCPNLTMNSSNWNGLGLLKAVRCFDFQEGCDQVTFHFLHFSVQEYMAALYISTLSDNEQIKLLKKTFWQYRFYNTWVMYVGITHGNSFALKHFLSGNWLQFSTKIFKTSSISNKFLKNKIKCLHLFQCLIESNDEDMIASVSQSFQGNKIDLSNQTLLPSDLNTLGFFLIRSINKEWEMLNLSGCSIGSIGSKILCDRFLTNNSRHMVAIRKINFSHNQLNYSSLAQLLKLFKSWDTSEIIITDSDRLKDNPDDLNEIVEDAFLLCKDNTQIQLQIGSFYFAHRIIIADYMHDCKNVYLIDCVCDGHIFRTKKLLAETLEVQKFVNVFLINSLVPNYFIKGVCSSLLNDSVRNKNTSNSGENNLLVFDHTLSDTFANEITTTMSDRILNFNGIMLIISKSEVQGIIKTVALSNRLSKLTLLNLIRKCRTMCHTNMQTCSWRQDLHCSGNIGDLIIYTFTELLYKITCDHCKCNLRIALREKDVVIAHNVDYSVLKNLLTTNESTTAVYISNCDIPSAEYETLCHSVKNIYIYNGRVTEQFIQMLSIDSSAKEVFIHNLIDIDQNAVICNNDLQRCSILLITKSALMGCKPTNEQLSLVLRLKPSITVLKLHNYQGNYVTINQVVTILANKLSELDLTNCSIGEIELLDILYQYLKTTKCFITVNTLSISLENLSMSVLPKLVTLLLMLKVKYLIFNGINHDVYKNFMKNFCTTKSTSLKKIFLSVTYNDKKAFIFCNLYCKQVFIILKGAVLYFISYDLFSGKTEKLVELDYIFHNFINHTLHKNVNLFCISCNVQIQELNIDGYHLQSTSAIIILKALESVSTLTKVFISKNNLTEKEAGNIAALISCNTQLQEVDISENSLQSAGVITISKALQGISTLTKLLISKNNITEKAASNIAALISCNTQLQDLDLSDNHLQSTGIITISNALQGISTLTKLLISKNNITEKAASNIAALISCNTQLQDLDLSDNHLQSTGIITISNALQGISTLKKIFIKKNNITAKASNDIATAVSCNPQLQEFDISNNDLLSEGIKTILKALQGIATLIKLNISKNNSTYIIADYLAVVISSNNQLQELNVSDTHLQETGAKTISKALQCISTLTKFCISNNFITENVAGDIAKVISCNIHLQELDISNNNLQTKGTVIILKALQNICTLTKLNISKNNLIFIVAYNLVNVICHNNQLQELNISDNYFQTTGAVIILNALQNISTLTKLCISKNKITDKAADDIATAISYNNQLQELNISGNHLETTGLVIIIKAFQSMNSVTKLYISSMNNITQKAADDIAAAISCNTQLQELDISDNNLQAVGGIKILKALQNNCNLTKLFISKNNVTDKAADDIAAVISCNTQLQELDISDNNLQTTGAAIILKALQNISTITKLCISKNKITDKAADDIAAVISFNTQIQELDISDNNLQTTGAAIILKALQNISTLTKLCISKNKITDKAADDIATAISYNNQLQELNISGNHLETTGLVIIIKAFQSINSVTKLYISSMNNITQEVADDIAAVISSNTQLQELDISDNNIQVVAGRKILQALQNISTLTKLFIGKNYITDKAADDIAAVISCNTQLQELDISEIYLHTTGAITISKALQNTSTLKKIYISKNDINYKSADDIAAAISCNTQLQELDISDNNLQAVGGIKILKALQNICTLTKLFISKNNVTDKAADDIAAVISCNTQIQELDISDNNLQTTGAAILLKALQNISTLTKLCISKNKITDKAAGDIAAVISCNTQIQELDISDNNLLTTGAVIILKALQHISTLSKLYISKNNINYESADNIAVAISCNTFEQLGISLINK